jgi:hypothetical protein
MSESEDDIERLCDIGDRILAGEPIESLELGQREIHFVVGYCERAVAEFFSAGPPSPHRTE